MKRFILTVISLSFAVALNGAGAAKPGEPTDSQPEIADVNVVNTPNVTAHIVDEQWEAFQRESNFVNSNPQIATNTIAPGLPFAKDILFVIEKISGELVSASDPGSIAIIVQGCHPGMISADESVSTILIPVQRTFRGTKTFFEATGPVYSESNTSTCNERIAVSWDNFVSVSSMDLVINGRSYAGQ